MKADFDFELPVCRETDFPPPQVDAERYLEFIEFNQRLIRDQDQVEMVLASRSRPVDIMFEIK